MRIQGAHLGVFVPGAFVVPENPILRGIAGLSDFVPGRFVVPENTVGVAGLAEFIDAQFCVPENPVTRGIGDLTPSAPMWPIPPNSVLRYSGLAGCGVERVGKSCGGSKESCSCGCKGGLGDIGESVSQYMTNLMAGDTTTLIGTGVGALVLGFLLFGRFGSNRSAYSSAKADARRKYREQLAGLRDQYPTAGRRIYRGSRAAAGAF